MVWFPYKNFSSKREKSENMDDLENVKISNKNHKLRNFSIFSISRYFGAQYLFLFFKVLRVLCVRGTFHWIWLKIGNINLVGERKMISRKAAWKELAQSPIAITMIIDLSLIKTYPKLCLTQNLYHIVNGRWNKKSI